MKPILILLLATLSFHGFGYSIKVTLIDMYTNSKLVDCDVRLEDQKGDLIQRLKTSSLGEVTFTNLKKKDLKVVAGDSEGRYLEAFGSVSGKQNAKFEFFMFPSPDFEKEIWLKEDSLYGSVDEVMQIDTVSDKKDFTLGSYPGGKEALLRLIHENIMYPEISRELGDQGKVVVEFIIELDGTISHINVRNSISPELDREAIRLTRIIGNLLPSEYNGGKVRSRATQSFTFTLM